MLRPLSDKMIVHVDSLQREIEAKEKASKPKTSKDLLLEMLDDDAVKAKIQDIVA